MHGYTNASEREWRFMKRKKKGLQSCTLAFVHAGRYATPVNLLVTLPGPALRYPYFAGVGGGVRQDVQKRSLLSHPSRSPPRFLCIMVTAVFAVGVELEHISATNITVV